MTPPGSHDTRFTAPLPIGALILLVACFNFMNLATARAMMRAREIALRKTVGAKRGQLILQFLGESVLMALLALVLALALVEMLLPAFDSFMQRPLGLDLHSGWPVLLLDLRRRGASPGLFSGSYPAVVLSGFRPATVLRTNSSGQGGFGTPAVHPGRAAVCGVHRLRHRGRRGVRPDPLRPQYRSGLPAATTFWLWDTPVACSWMGARASYRPCVPTPESSTSPCPTGRRLTLGRAPMSSGCPASRT